jgi:serine/threonine protein kinase
MSNYEVLINRMIDSYQITQLMGFGGMGAVYKAYDHQSKRWVALKIINPQLLTQPDLIQQFRLEAEAATGLNHHNIAQLYYVGTYQNVPYYTMEFIEGKSFAEILKEKGRIAGTSCLNYLYQICDGLEYCQYNGVIHRDIKPANLMISRDGIVKVVDFGLAMVLQEGSRSQESDQILGTPKYISPEAGTTKILDHRSDIYSLGATFYHMMAGEPPFNASTPMELLQKHINEPLIPLNEINPFVPELVSDIISKMLEKNPKQRYQSYKEIKDDIDKAKAAGFKKTKETTISAVAVKEAARIKGKFPIAIIYIGAMVILFIVVMLFFLNPSASKKGKESKTDNDGVDFDAIKKRPATGGGPRISQPFSPPIGTGTFNDGMRGISEAHKAQVISQMRQIYMLAMTYYSERGVLPDSVETLYQETNMQGLPTRDSWGNHYQLIYRGGEDISVISAGPDSSYGTADDIEIRNGEVIGGY